MTHRSTAPHAALGCERGAMCTDDRPGHAVTMIRLRLAHLDRGGWDDAVVIGTAPDGSIAIALWAADVETTLWHHAERRDLLPAGTPVAVNLRHGVLAVGTDRLNVAVA